MRCFTNLPDAIRLPTGEVLKPVIGGHLELKPFLTLVDVRKNGWLADLPCSEETAIIEEAKRRGLKFRRVAVLSRNLRNRLNLYGRLYQPTQWVFVQVKEKPCN